jgi:hypothetical protein
MTVERLNAPTGRLASWEVGLLWLLSGLFLARVIGQLLLATLHVTFLPPMPEWYSGLLPYPALLPTQILILGLMAKINWDASRQQGFFMTPRPRLGMVLLAGSIVYVSIMVIRYFVSGQLHPERRFWPPGSIPIVFHFVLASYLYILSRFARRPVGA